MRLTMTAIAALTLAAAAPAVADATVEGTLSDLIDNPIMCASPDEAATEPGAPVAEMVMVEGFGTGGFRIDTANPEAQAWFDHAVRLRWAFEHTESVRAFQRARLLDPTCAMCAWGEAWAMGPNLNGGGTGDEVRLSALAIAREARRLARNADPVHRQMIDALIQRYSGWESSRARRFAQRMDRIARDHPADVAVAVVTADAWMMVVDQWWDDDGVATDASVTRAVSILETTLARAPDDPGAIHLYIHLTEWSDDPHRAIPYGERLATLAPGASHLVHMPSHTFFRVGRYRDAMMSNVNAVALDVRYAELASPPGGVRGMRLHGHNIHFGMGGALMSGGATEGLRLAERFLGLYSAGHPRLDTAWGQATANNAYALFGRFGSDEQLAALAEPAESRPLQRIGLRYARGEAAARRGDAQAVEHQAAEIARLRQALPHDADHRFTDAFSEVFQRVLEGRAAMIRRDWPAAIQAYGRAAALQGEGDEGGDPPVIWFPTRRSLAAALLASGDAAGARDKILELLEDWPSDPYSYFVLAEAQEALGDPEAADRARTLGRVEWIGGAMSLGLA
jgi:tetratricopeptide (TPR) repeat protein